MKGYFLSGTLYKGIFLLILILIAIEYLFGSVSDSTSYVFKSTTLQRENPSRQTEFHFKTPTKIKTHRNNTQFTNTTSSLSNVNASSISFGRNLTNFPLTLDLMSPESIINSTRVLNITELPFCPEDPPNLVGAIPVKRSPVPTIEQLEARFSWLKPGGQYAPESCRVLKKVAIIIPFRCRGEHLLLFLQHMHPFLKKQQIDYRIFIIEQEGNGLFNRALLMNVGYMEALKLSNFDCFILHDIDLLPENDKNLYTCPKQPRHMSVAIDCFKYRLPYREMFGGVSAISTEHFRLVNGFSNSFWGWGGEDDDMSNRIRHHKLFISRYPPTIARYTMLSHRKEKPSPNRYDMLKLGQQKFDKDGLNTLKYAVVKSKNLLLYTWILVKVDVPS